MWDIQSMQNEVNPLDPTMFVDRLSTKLMTDTKWINKVLRKHSHF